MRQFVHASVVAACLLVLGCGRGTKPRPILIGHFAPSGGPNKAIGDHARQGIRLAMEEMAEENFSIGGRPVQVLHPAYPAEEPPKLQPEAVRLLTVEQVSALLGGLDLDQVQVLGHAAQPHAAALVTAAELPAERLAENVFSVNVGLDFEARVLARFVRQELKAEKITILSDSRRLASSALAAALKKELLAEKTSVVLSLTAKRDADWPDVMENLKKTSVQALLYCGTVSDLPRLRARLRTAGLKPALIVAGAGEELELLRLDPDTGAGVHAATPFLASASDDSGQSFVRKYQEHFHEPADAAAALAYDGLHALVEALRRAADPSPAKVQSVLAAVDTGAPLVSVTGTYTFSKGHAARRPLFVVQVEDGQLVRPKRYDPDAE